MHPSIDHKLPWSGYHSTLAPTGPTNDRRLHFSLFQLAKCFQLARLRPFRWWFMGFVLVLLNIIILSPVPLLLKTVAVLGLTNWLPGALVVYWLVRTSQAPPPWWEQSLYSLGAGYGCMIIPMLAVSYLPGGVTREQTLLVFDIGLLGLITLIHWRPTSQGRPEAAQKPAASASRTALPGPQIDRRWLLIGILSLALTGGFLRFANLDYAEFQGDEARVTLYSANVIQGYENALFIHRKGPAEILLPTVLYALTEQLTETTARLPFTLANFAALFALFLLGWRL
ncbi:MAG: hypothetical protein NT075_16255, partial [Chloroflexi bacterium]|nr:hypothetical protein [Chloroflexota bacterium]